MSLGYTQEWIDKDGLNVAYGYCISLIRGIDPDEALRRLEIPPVDVSTKKWVEHRLCATGSVSP